MKTISWRLWAALAAAILPAGMVTGQTTRPFVHVPDPLSGDNPRFRLLPAKLPQPGQRVVDSRLRTAWTRVTQEPGLRHEYSRHDPFNANRSMIVLMDTAKGEFRVYSTAVLPYDRKENLVRALEVEEPRWDDSDPNLIWGVHEFRIETVNVKTGQVAVIKDFTRDATVGPILKAAPDLYRVTMKDEGEASMDRRYWALMIQGSKEDYRPRHLIVWDRKDDRIVGQRELTLKEKDIDWVGMSPLGNWVLIGGDSETTGELRGLTLANRELTRFHRVDYATAHSDVGLDVDGHEVIVMQNVRTDRIDLIPLDPKTKPILEADGSYEGTNRTPLLRLFSSSESPIGLNSGVHISCNAPGWCVVSTYIEPKLKEQNWLDRSIILVRLDPRRPRAWYLAKVNSTRAEYWEETQATISRDGSKVVWAANFDEQIGKEKPVLMQLDMPQDWMKLLKD